MGTRVSLSELVSSEPWPPAGNEPVLHVERPPAPVPPARTGVTELPLDRIMPNPQQPRITFDEDDLDELAASIASAGVLQPVVVRPAGDGAWELIMGERRVRAARMAGLPSIPAVVRDTSDEELLRHALIENVVRCDLNPIEEAVAYRRLIDEAGATQEEVAQAVSKTRAAVGHSLGLLRLPEDVQRRVAAGVISKGHAKCLTGVADPARVQRLADRIVAENLSVRALEEIITLGENDGWVGRPVPRKRSHERRVFEEVSSLLEQRLETRVRVESGKSRGRITIEFAGDEDLRRIVSAIAAAGAGQPA